MGDSISGMNAYQYCVLIILIIAKKIDFAGWFSFFSLFFALALHYFGGLVCMFSEAHFTHSVAFRSSTLIYFAQQTNEYVNVYSIGMKYFKVFRLVN